MGKRAASVAKVDDAPAIVAPSVRRVSALSNEDVAMMGANEKEALAKWRQMTDEELDTEIASYRDKLIEIQDQLTRAGEPVEFISKLLEKHTKGIVKDMPDEFLSERVQVEEEATTEANAEEDDMEEGDVADIDPSEWMVPPQCIPIHANVTAYDWKPLYESTQFDAIMMDPPWQLATANPTRGVSLGYSQLTDQDITNLPIPKLQSNGLLFVWVINAKYKFCLDLFKKWGYTFIDEIVWVKTTVNRRLAKSHGFYLQHAKEVCLVAKKGKEPENLASNVGSDIILAERRGQSQKPTEIYHLIEKLLPNGKYLEIFARKNNLRNYWVSVGNEVTGTGPPKEDMACIEAQQAPQGAVYGAAAPRGK
uniref:mRNA m(6)A methyltransferase n=1 Tax=Pyramimonas obovata TaxID=1411642 RepID=A0A7S0MQZ7_9CHLO|mmetsp:Transcript_11246/g.23476  ORF Transcript_11246/g.23476 Transcript_11246/m.23476 type:complete len:365 (+) Transcript_11246:156-1250(+)